MGTRTPQVKSKKGVLRPAGELRRIARALEAEAGKVRAPVMDLMAAQTKDPFRILVGTLLSARTKDAVTAGAIERLFKEAPTASALGALPLSRIEKLIFPVGFYHAKAQHLKALPEALDRLFGGEIPHTVDELTSLPGVGRKTANLVVALAFGLPAICVDTHVHRINNRLGIVRTSTPAETEVALRAGLPKALWIPWNRLFVSFGQTLCKPVRPACERCPVKAFCAEARS